MRSHDGKDSGKTRIKIGKKLEPLKIRPLELYKIDLEPLKIDLAEGRTEKGDDPGEIEV